MSTALKVECLNPNTGGKLNIDASIYSLFVKAIKHSLKENEPLTYTQLVTGIKKYLAAKETVFPRSVSWYAVIVKNDLEVKGEIEVFMEKSKKMHRIKSSKKQAQ